MKKTKKIGFGGSCHWCTEAIFSSLNGVKTVEQGWISSLNDDNEFSEAVIVNYDEDIIPIENLVEIHLNTHSCTSEHVLRNKYRSAVYVFNSFQEKECLQIIKKLQADFNQPIITKVISFDKFKLNHDHYLNYYYNNPDRPFCQNIVNPKLQKLISLFPNAINTDKMTSIEKLDELLPVIKKF